MKFRPIISFFCSLKATLILLSLYAFLLAFATFVEKYFEAAIARQYIYHSVAFIFFQMLLIINCVGVAYQRKWWSRKLWGSIILHFSFIVIFIGAFLTHCLGYEGVLHIREGQQSNTLRTTSGSETLPFNVRLIHFNVSRYPGSHSPSGYQSELVIAPSDKPSYQTTVSVNKTHQIGSYRLFQASFDKDEMGTILSVNYDPWGMQITYIGYALLLLGILGIMIQKKSYVRSLVHALSKSGKISLILLSFIFSSSLMAQDDAAFTISKNHASSWSDLLVQAPSGRIEPMNTYATKFLRKVYRKSHYNGLSAEQVMVGFLLYPGHWNTVPIIRQDNKELGQLINNDSKYITFLDVFNENGDYKIASQVEHAYELQAGQRTSFDKDILKLNERINLLYGLQNGALPAIFPLHDSPTHQWYSFSEDNDKFSGKDSMFVSNIIQWYAESANEALNSNNWSEPEEIVDMIKIYQHKRANVDLPSIRKLKIELLYNRIDPFFITLFGYLAIGLLLFIFTLLTTLYSKMWSKTASAILVILLFGFFILHTAGIASRWYVSGQGPWSNTYETMIYISWMIALCAIFLYKYSRLTTSLATFLAAVILFAATLNGMDPEITPLVPVLQSYWLLIHVAIITASYSFFGISSMLGTLSLAFQCCKKDGKYKALHSSVKELRIINELSLYIGVFLLTIGIFIGAIWANESWGRYWGWDPKETWALITMLVYVIILHVRFTTKNYSDYLFSVLSIFGFASVLMTYFGVNYFLSGLHSYGTSELPTAIYGIIAYYIFLVLFSIYVYKKLYR